jgi:hypothetical protein
MNDGIGYGLGLLFGTLFRFGLLTGYVYLAIRTLQYFGVTI